MVQAGQYVTDGTAVFLVTDIRDGLQVGDIKLSPILRPGYVKANGALLSNARTNYPRLVAFLTANTSLNAGNDTAWNANKALYVYNSSANTLRVPDATGRVLQGGTDVKSVEAGVPNLTGSIGVINNGGVGNSGVFSYIHDVGNPNGTTLGPNGTNGSGFNAKLFNPIYGSSTTVQSPALTMIPQIKY